MGARRGHKQRGCRGRPAAAWGGGVLLGAALLVAGCGERDSGSAAAVWKPPGHVILISLDTLRADRLGCYGYERDTSPNLDKLAEEAVVFATVGAQATQTLISHKSLLTAKYPLRLVHETTGADLQTLGTLPQANRLVVDTFAHLKSKPLLAGFQSAGYATAAFTDGRWMSRAMGFDEGFDDFNDAGGHLSGILPRVHDWLIPHRRAKFFLFVHAYDTHCPYVCREPFNSKFCPDHTRHIPLAGKCGKPDLMSMSLRPEDLRAISDHYDGGIASADDYVGRLIARLRELDLYDEALLVVTSDHGESLGTHEQIGHGGLYVEQLLVPLIVKFPHSWNVPPQRVAAPVALLDVMPTLCAAGGIEVPADLDGRSLLPLLRGEPWPRRNLVAQITYNEGRQAITNAAKRAVLVPGHWLLIHDAATPLVELFDLQADASGLTPVAAQPPELLPRLLAALAEHDPGAAAGGFTAPERVEMSAELKQQLEALGYVEP